MNAKTVILILTLVITSLNESAFACDGVFVKVDLSELYFDDSNNWKIEINYDFKIPTCMKNALINPNPIDSIFLITSTGKSKLKNTAYFKSEGYYIISKDSLISNLLMNQIGDSICIKTYLSDQAENKVIISKLIYGNMPNSKVKSPSKGQSIMLIASPDKYCRTNSPTLGRINNSNLGTTGYLKGKFYDKNNNLIKNQTISYYYDFLIDVDSDGHFKTKLYSRIDTILFLVYNTQQLNVPKAKVISIPYNIDPDSTIEMDLHLTGEIYDNIQNMSIADMEFYPNPVNERITFKHDSKLSGNLSITNIQGQIIHQFNLNSQQETFTWNIPSNLENGIYIYNMQLSDKQIHKGKFLILK